jgi:hypothetical protein
MKLNKHKKNVFIIFFLVQPAKTFLLVAKTLPAPQNTDGMANPTPLRDDPIYKESIFGTHICVRENNKQMTVQPTTFGLMSTVDTVWQEITANYSNAHNEMLVEGLHYNATGLLWLKKFFFHSF